MELGVRKVEVWVKGPGAGREAAIRSLSAAGLEITAIKDSLRFRTMAVAPRKGEESDRPGRSL